MAPKADTEFHLKYALRYRAEARADLYSEYGVSLAELVTQGRLIELADLLSQLPQASRFWAALMDDSEYAEMVAEASLYTDDASEDPPKWAPSYRDYSAMYQLVAQVHDSVGVLNYTTAAVQGGKPKKPRSFPAPVTAIDKAQQVAEKGLADSLLSKMGRGALNAGPRVRPKLQKGEAPADDYY